jgi:hypothetical protein
VAADGTPACATTDLKAKVGAGQGTAGSVYEAIDFTNTSSDPCTLYGYPGVSLTSGGSPGSQLGAAARRGGASAPRLVTLAPGGTANATLQVTNAGNYPKATCGPVSSADLQVYPPNQTTALYLTYSTTACSKSSVKLLTISVVQPGS